MANEHSDPSDGRGAYPVLERYELLSQIGQGGMGTVYLARHTGLGKVVAVKILPARMMQDAKAVARFEREMRAVGLLNHDNVVVATDGGVSGATRFLVMEFVDGLDLGRLVGRIGPLRSSDACEILRQAALGLQHAHEHGLLHRDIKPSNLMLTKQGCVKVLDLGLARLHHETAGELSITDSGEIMGTPDYMSPEQSMNSAQIDIRADIYALGCSLYNLLTGRAPFSGSRYHTPLKKLMAHVRSQPRSVETQRPDVPQGVRDVLARMMSKSPADRYATPADLAIAVEPFCDEADLPELLKRAEGVADGAHPRPLSETTAPLDSALKTEKLRDPRWTRRLVLAGLMTVIVSVGGWLLVKSLTPPQPPVAEPSLSKTETATTASQKQATVAQEEPPTKPGWHGWPADAPPPAIAPFNAEQARQHQEAWAKYLKVPIEYTNSIGMKFRLIPPGEFLMGRTAEELEDGFNNLEAERQKNPALLTAPFYRFVQDNIESEAPLHKVILTEPFYLGTHEVTQAAYQIVMGQNPSSFAKSGSRKGEVAGIETTEHPVEMVSSLDAIAFCDKLSEIEERLPFKARSRDVETATKFNGIGYRLPTEAEWEFSCRAGTTTMFGISDQKESLTSAVWFEANSENRTHSVGELKANPFGLCDMLGNVWEWVGDGWEIDFYDRQAQDQPAINPKSPLSDPSLCVIRSGAFVDRSPAVFARGPAWNAASTPRSTVVGFRVALPVSVAKPVAKVTARATPKTPMSTAVTPSGSKPSDKTGWHGWPTDAPPPAIAPFNAKQALQHQEAWAKYLKVSVEYTNSIGMKLRLIPPGEFLMGATQAEFEDAIPKLDSIPFKEEFRDNMMSATPQHRVILTQPFYFGIHEVTQANYQRVMDKSPSHFSATGTGMNQVVALDTSQHPVETVSRADAAEFCAKLSQLEQRTPFYLRVRDTENVTLFDGTGYRLPTESQWEFAGRAGTTTNYWIDDQEESLKLAAWHRENSDNRTHPVGELQTNPWGLFDIHGNVSEWADDGWELTTFEPYRNEPAINPNSPVTDAARCVIRGNNWSDKVFLCGVWSRAPVLRQHVPRCLTVGFRVALPVSVAKTVDKAIEGEPMTPVSADSFGHNRDVAQSILRRGGLVSVAGINEEVQWEPHPQNSETIWLKSWIKSIQELPKSDFLLTGVQVGAINDEDVEDLAACSHLQAISLWKVPITDNGLRLLAKLPRLKGLVIIGCKVTDTGVAHLKRSKSIEILDLGLIPL